MNCLVMAGGQGTRFWPESTSKKPKQYLQLFGKKTLLQQTLERFVDLAAPSDRYIVTVESQKDLVEPYRTSIAEDGIIFEPCGRNTAPCILLSLATLMAKGADKDEIVAIMPADHVILNNKGFAETLRMAMRLADSRGDIVTIGVTPSFPHTGYGYIKRAERIEQGAYRVDQFKEKPKFEIAQSYLASGEYYWNAGMFVATIGTLLEEFQKNAPEIFSFYQQLVDHIGNPSQIEGIYKSIPAKSIDYAVMEKSNRVSVVSARFDWNDLGSWNALESVIAKVDHNFEASSNGHYYKNASGNIIYCPDKFVSLVNVHDLVVISNEKAVVVFPKEDSQEVKKIVETLAKKRPELV